MHCREILFTPRCSPRGVSEVGQLFSIRRTIAEQQLPNFRILAYFRYTKPLKRTFRWPAYSPGVFLHRRMITIFLCGTERNRFYLPNEVEIIVVVEVQRGAFQDRRFPATSGRGAGDPQTCRNFRLWQIAISIHNATRQIWTKDVWKRTILRMNVLSHQISLHLPLKSPQNPILGDLSMRNLLYSRTLKELRRWNFTVI